MFGSRLAVIDGDGRLTYADLWERSCRLAGGPRALGVEVGDRVAVLAPNTRLLLEAHYGAPLAGAVLVALNTRLGPAELGHILGHAGARVLLYDHALARVVAQVPALDGLRVVEAPGGSPNSDFGGYAPLSRSSGSEDCGNSLRPTMCGTRG